MVRVGWARHARPVWCEGINSADWRPRLFQNLASKHLRPPGADAPAATLSEADGTGVDTVVTAFDIPALPSTIENLQMTGTRDVKAVLNDQPNQVTGNAGTNRVESGGGDDMWARPPMI